MFINALVFTDWLIFCWCSTPSLFNVKVAVWYPVYNIMPIFKWLIGYCFFFSFFFYDSRLCELVHTVRRLIFLYFVFTYCKIPLSFLFPFNRFPFYGAEVKWNSFKIRNLAELLYLQFIKVKQWWTCSIFRWVTA